MEKHNFFFSICSSFIGYSCIYKQKRTVPPMMHLCVILKGLLLLCKLYSNVFLFNFEFASGKSNGDPDCEPPHSVPVQSSLDEINPETKAKIEEEAYNKGWAIIVIWITKKNFCVMAILFIYLIQQCTYSSYFIGYQNARLAKIVVSCFAKIAFPEQNKKIFRFLQPHFHRLWFGSL